jgi:DNA/RNA-binding domain of Phe-tRNA-synthetase-like protein
MLLFELAHPTLRLGVVRAERVRFAPSTQPLLDELTGVEARLRGDPTLFSESMRSAVRDVLRVGGYKPTGRGKPASELLLGMAQKAGLPRIGNLVEINNLVSLESALPISIFDAARLGERPTVRFGRPGENYVFNASGHSMELAGLPVICRGAGDEPVGNAVRDSMQCKVDVTTTGIVAVAYGTRAHPETTLLAALQRLAGLLRQHADGQGLEVGLVPD